MFIDNVFYSSSAKIGNLAMPYLLAVTTALCLGTGSTN